jgi:hypothetical protein
MVTISTGHDRHVHHRVGGEHERHRIAIDGTIGAERMEDLVEAPAQRPQRVVGVSKQERRQLRARRRPFAQHQVSQKRPALATAELVRLGRAPINARTTEQVDGGHQVSLKPSLTG